MDTEIGSLDLMAEVIRCANCKTEDTTYWVDGVRTCGRCLVAVVDAHLTRGTPIMIQTAK